MPERISVRVPATSANLGCAFDCAALALSLYLDMHVTPRADHEITVRYSGVNPERIATDSSNLVAKTIRETLVGWNKSRGFDLELVNQIPVGAGLGSSAAAIVGALATCHWLADVTLFDEELVSLATEIEGHPDNVAAAWLGGLTVSTAVGRRIYSYSCPVPQSVHLVLVIPDYAVPTEQARQALPGEYSRQDAIHNLQRAVALTAQMFSGKAELRPWFFDDRWHQPYRAKLMPGLSEVLEYRHQALLGTCVSGAGPTILAFARGDAAPIGEALCQVLSRKGVKAEAQVLAADNLGAKGWSLPA